MYSPKSHAFWPAFVLLLAATGPWLAAPAWAHCDGLDGPVVKAAQKALDARDVNLVLIWVQSNDEAEVTRAFQQALGVRALSPEARQLADTWFFETLVRLHRAGEGAPYTGLKPAGRDLGPAIPAADRALADGSVDALVELVVDRVRSGLRERFEHALATQRFERQDLAAGREHVRAYVTFLHYVEGIYDAAGQAGHAHPEETEPAHDRHPIATTRPAS